MIVQPIFKKISSTSVCTKILEHVVRFAITSHLNQNSILVDAEHGFRKRRSCETQLVLTIDDLAVERDKRCQMDTILLDFCKVFDKLPHQQLPLKFHHYGIQRQTLRWMTGLNRLMLRDRRTQLAR